MIYLLATIIFILLQAFFSGIETGLVSLPRPRVLNGVKKGDRRAEILHFFVARPSLMLSATLLGTNISVVCASLTAKQAVKALGFEGNMAMLAASMILTVILLAAEIIPKDWFRQSPYLRCSFFAPLLYYSYQLLRLPAWMLSRFTDQVIKLLTPGISHQDANILLREDFRLLLRESEEGGIIDSVNANILDNAVDFSRMTVRDVMVGFGSVHTIPAGITVREAVAACRGCGCSRLPVAQSNVVTPDVSPWLGTFSLYDAIHKIPESDWDRIPVDSYLRPLQRITADAEISEIIRLSRAGKSPLLTVVSPTNHNTCLGIVTPLDVVSYLFNR